jgi:hypothetical protein
MLAVRPVAMESARCLNSGPYIEATRYRAEAARLCDELAQIENQSQSSVAVPAP